MSSKMEKKGMPSSRSKSTIRTPRVEAFELVMERLKKTPSRSPSKRKSQNKVFY